MIPNAQKRTNNKFTSAFTVLPKTNNRQPNKAASDKDRYVFYGWKIFTLSVLNDLAYSRSSKQSSRHGRKKIYKTCQNVQTNQNIRCKNCHFSAPDSSKKVPFNQDLPNEPEKVQTNKKSKIKEIKENLNFEIKHGKC